MDNRTRTIQSVTIWGAVCNLGLSVIKMAAGILGRSAAMTADAIHSLSDLISDFIVIVFNRISSRGSDKNHDFGHGKFETLATLAVSILLALVGVKMLVGSVSNIKAVLSGEELEVPGMIALAVAALSIIVKEVLFQWTYRVGKKVQSPLMKANAWHHRSDALSSVGALLGIGLSIFLGGKWLIMDPLVGGVISVVIVFVAVKMALPSLSQLTDASLPDSVENQISDIITAVPGVEDVHELKTRESGHSIIVSVHIVVCPDMTVSRAHEITVEVEKNLRAAFGTQMQISIHVEPSSDAL